MRRSFSVVGLLCVLLALTVAGSSERSLPERLDGMLSGYFTADAPGAAVIVVKDGKVLFRRAYGLANLETRTPMRPEMVFEIGSVTKQFTAAAILLLAEQRKLALDDDIRKYLPLYPDKGHTITIEHLLTHTSGIPSYTDDPKWRPLWRQDLSPDQVIDLTKDNPLLFTPGSKWRYNNTGYTMLGAIIEKVSGVSYAEFIRQQILEPLGMKHTVYGSFTDVIPNRASGYTRGANGWQNAPYLSMTHPYSAGALMSSVDDLAKWDAAVSESRLLRKASWERAFAGFRLSDQEDSHYGYGWQIGRYDGRSVVHHGGGIPGYICQVMRIPEERLYLAILTNSDDQAFELDFVLTRLAAEVTGRPYREPVAVDVTPQALDAYVGTYQVEGTARVRTVTRDGDRLFVQSPGGPNREILPAGDGVFFRRGSLQRFHFERDSSGRVTALIIRSLEGTPNVARRR